MPWISLSLIGSQKRFDENDLRQMLLSDKIIATLMNDAEQEFLKRFDLALPMLSGCSLELKNPFAEMQDSSLNVKRIFHS